MVAADIIEGDAELRRLRDRLRTRPGSETYYDPIELGRRVEAALAGLRAAATAAIIAALSPLAEREAERRLLDEDMVLNRAFPVPRAAEALFDEAMAGMIDRCGARIMFRYVGPVPPYNFVRLRTDWLAAA